MVIILPLSVDVKGSNPYYYNLFFKFRQGSNPYYYNLFFKFRLGDLGAYSKLKCLT